MNSYPLISEHGLIGNLQTAALVSTDGTVDWFCVPRFDSPSVFASLLDAERGGRFRIAPEGSNYVTKQLYFPDTADAHHAVHVTPTASARSSTSCRSTSRTSASDRTSSIRIVRVVRGQMTLPPRVPAALRLRPRPSTELPCRAGTASSFRTDEPGPRIAPHGRAARAARRRRARAMDGASRATSAASCSSRHPAGRPPRGRRRRVAARHVQRDGRGSGAAGSAARRIRVGGARRSSGRR